MIIRPSITAIASRKFYRLLWTSPEFKRATAEAFQFVAGASFRLPASQGSMGTLRRYSHDTLQVDRERRPRFSAARLPWPFPILENHRVARLGGKPSKRWRSRRRGTTAGDGGGRVIPGLPRGLEDRSLCDQWGPLKSSHLSKHRGLPAISALSLKRRRKSPPGRKIIFVTLNGGSAASGH